MPHLIDPPKPSINFLPEWYRDMSSFIDKKNKTSRAFDRGRSSNLTVKSCIPFFDSMTSGYTVVLPCDIMFVDPNEFGQRVLWDVDFPVVTSHLKEQLNQELKEYDEIVLKWMFYYFIKTPKGYSCIFSNPKNNFDLPFRTIEAIVDTDKYDAIINFPFLIKKNFLGTIKKGTPICNIFPFKRDKWMHKTKSFDKKLFYENKKLNQTMGGFYKKFIWQKKQYK